MSLQDEKLTFWRHRPTLVTGGTGLLGGWVVRRLLKLGADVICLVRDWVPQSEFYRAGLFEQVKVVEGDVCEQSFLERVLGEYEVVTVIHLAAQTIVGIAYRNPISTFQTNIAGTWALLEACRRSPTVQQIVFASSDKAYGEVEGMHYHEEMPLRGTHPYDVSKSCADLIAQSYATTYHLPIAITRCGNLYGGGDLNWNRIVPGTIRAILQGRRPVIRSDGQYVRDYFYVEDAAAVYTLLAERLASDSSLYGEAFNFSNETPITVLEMVDRIGKLMGSTLEPEVRNEAIYEIRSQSLCSEKARKVLGWQPLYSLDEGLKKTIAWYRAYLGAAS
jgi:CDP-glucose 4,6-dehydratase